MTLDRQAIEKKDFPIGRRGYEVEAVDAHLAAVSAQVDELRSEAGGKARGGSLALAASRQVQAIVEAAESSAAEIESAAQADAARIRSEAAGAAAQTRDEAVERSTAHVGEVHAATSAMLQRVDAMESELGALVESLRTGAHRLTADLSLLQGSFGELQAAAGAGPAQPVVLDPPPEYAAAAAAQPAVGEEPPVIPEPDPLPEEAEPEPVVPEPTPIAPAEPAPPADAPQSPPLEPAAGSDEDVEGARLIALNMALNGSPREEAEQYLSENFALSDRDALLDEVYATVGA